jgi:hypothetical protein
MNLDKRPQLWIALALFALMAATRGHHFASLAHLPSASLAVFFLAGFYVRRAWIFVALLVEAALLDYSAITYGGVSSFCVTPAYGFLIPAYGTMWLAGNWFANRYRFAFSALLPFGGSLLVGAGISELFSSGGFYFFGGRYTDQTLAVFGERLLKYFPHQLSGLAFWIGVAVAIHVAFALVRGQTRTRDLNA